MLPLQYIYLVYQYHILKRNMILDYIKLFSEVCNLYLFRKTVLPKYLCIYGLCFIQGVTKKNGHLFIPNLSCFWSFLAKVKKRCHIIRFRWFFCRTVHCSDILGSGIILENVNKLIFQNLHKWASHQRPNCNLELGPYMTVILFQIRYTWVLRYWQLPKEIWWL